MTNRSFRTARQSVRQILGIPALLAVASLIGLIVALTGDGWRDLLSALLLFLPLTAIALAWARRG